MRTHSFTILILASALCSCGLKEFGEAPQPVVIPDYIDDPIVPQSTIVVGVSYPDESYDWNRDYGHFHIANLVVYKDGELTIEVPVSDEGFISEESDIHRYVGGHLYTDWSTDSHTVISRDGTELFRYPAVERILLLAEKDGKVLTLGESRSGRGFSSRADGEPLFLGLDGYAFQNAGLSPDGDIRFFYGISVNSTSGELPEYFAVCGRENLKISLPSDVGSVYGFAFPADDPQETGQPEGVRQKGERQETGRPGSDGQDGGRLKTAAGAADLFGGITALCRIPNESGSYKVAMYSADTGESTELSDAATKWSWIRMGTVLGDRRPVLSVWVRTSKILGESTNIFCDDRRVALWYGGDIPVGFRVCDDGSVVGVRKPVSGTGREILYRQELRDTLPEGYTVMTGDAVCVSEDGVVRLGLSSKNGGKALLWEDGIVDTLDFRGVVTAVLTERQ